MISVTTDADVKRAWREWLPTLPSDERQLMYDTRDEDKREDRFRVPGAVGAAALIISAPESVWPGWDPPAPTRAGKRRDVTPAVRVVRDGIEDWQQLGNDENAIGIVITFAAAAAGYEVADLLAPTPRGRLSADEQERRARLADVVASLRARGAKLEAIGSVIGRSKPRVLELARAGKPNF